MCDRLDGDRQLLIAIIPMHIGVIVAVSDRAARTAKREVVAWIDARAVHVEGLAAPGVVAVNARATPRLADAAPGVTNGDRTTRLQKSGSEMQRLGWTN